MGKMGTKYIIIYNIYYYIFSEVDTESKIDFDNLDFDILDIRSIATLE